MTLPEGRKPLLWQDMEFAKPVRADQFNCLSGHPSTWQQEVEQLRAHISAALDCLEASKFTNAEHARAKDILRNALGDDQ
jgi:hypothetical protein